MTPSLPLPRRLAAAALASGAALVLGAMLLPGCAGDARAAPAKAPPEAALVRAAAVERGPVERPIRATGTVAARREYQLAFRAGGLLGEVAVEAGQRVRRGQVLARLDAPDVAAQAHQAREAAGKAARDLARVRALRQGGSVPAAALEDAETGAAVAEAASRAADFQLRTSALLAPEDGWVDRRLAEPGEVVAPGRPVLQLSGAGGAGRGWVVKAAVPEQDVLEVRPGDAAQVTLDARPGLSLAGRVVEVARQPSRGTGTWEVEIRLVPSGEALLPGLTARVALARTVPASGTVPLAALLDGDGERGAVLALEGNRVRRVPVRIAFLQGDRAVLAAGLAGVELVVTEGAARLADGAQVRLAP